MIKPAQQEVKTILGKPNYRRFDGAMEEWEYRGYLSKAGHSVICVNFIDNRVVGLDSFRDGAPTAPPAPSFSLGIGGTVTASDIAPACDYRAMRNDEFARFLNDVKSKTFDSDRTDFIEKATRDIPTLPLLHQSVCNWAFQESSSLPVVSFLSGYSLADCF